MPGGGGVALIVILCLVIVGFCTFGVIVVREVNRRLDAERKRSEEHTQFMQEWSRAFLTLKTDEERAKAIRQLAGIQE